jgi:hypothetical protein
MGGYKLSAVCLSHEGVPCDFSWMIQTSSNQGDWEDLSSGTWFKDGANCLKDGVMLLGHASTSYLRFIFIKNKPQDLLMIKTLQIFNL